jgi:hypothetical protein
MPIVRAPPDLAARATAPMQEMLPPPLTSQWPRAASSVPTSAASRTYDESIVSLEEQKTQMASELPGRVTGVGGRSGCVHFEERRESRPD